ncbi:uncharacterized protein LOC111380944 [Olea europaea var. sylvestris]|uniref:Uncharacterized protein LOC111380944 n=1 Tax=Olea europaea subsp. europaea TaxID=158383 RepID=A0A8S0PYB1_OLEEU|nr:uncharacterized protein LOC111380944 [Olea europaea var. sylvestris]CAA2956576.1 uncharacterized protein LOC111380944 [Olea europaea subsp. europaea]
MALAPSMQVPLIEPHPVELDTELEKSLKTLETFLGLIGFGKHTVFGTAMSWLVFIILAVALPVLSIQIVYCSNCEKYEIKSFELEIMVSQTIDAAISLLCISHIIRKYGVRKMLFVYHCHGHLTQFRNLCLQKIRVFYCLLTSWVVICLILKVAREITRMVHLHHDSWWWSALMLLACIISYTYVTLVFLAGCAVFHLVGNLQVIHFENYAKLLERDLDVSVYIEEHMRLTSYLSKISHRFRVFLLLEFLVVTVSQFMALLQTTGNRGIINFINGGDFAVLSIVQLVGIVLCLNAAAKISHRAQGLGSIASRWHALISCTSNDGSFSAVSDSGGNSDVPFPVRPLSARYSESDLESSEYSQLHMNLQFTSSMSSYQKRQAFVTYVQSNTGGFTIFGWMVDRMLINTIFFIELSLVFFVLGKTITITTR